MKVRNTLFPPPPPSSQDTLLRNYWNAQHSSHAGTFLQVVCRTLLCRAHKNFLQPPLPPITDGFREIKIWTSWKSFNIKSQETNNLHYIRGCSNKIPNFQFPHWPVTVEGHVTWHFPIGYILRGLLQLEDLEVHTATLVWHNEVRVNGTHGTACLLTATHASHEHYWVGQWDSLPAHCNTHIIITWTLHGGSKGHFRWPACSLQHMNTTGWVNGTLGTTCLLIATHASSHEHYRVGQWDSLPVHCNTHTIITWTLQGGSMGQPVCSLQHT